jgi:hypothetical protein
MRSPIYPSVYVPLIYFEPTGSFYDIKYKSHATQNDLRAMIFNPVSSNHSDMADVQTFEVDAKSAAVEVTL